MPVSVLYRGIVLLLWALAAWNSWVCRGLFWDGASFLANIIERGTFHDFYPARAHVAWVTELPVLAAIRLGVTDTRWLAVVQSAALFALPAGLYHLALARLRDDATALAIVMAAIALVYLPTSFLIVGEYNATYAAAAAAMAVALSIRNRGDAILLALLGALCLRSYEAMVYLGPLLGAAAWWSSRNSGDNIVRLLGRIAALCFVGGALVSGITMAVYWHHPHFVLVRAAVLDFWQNLQFVVPLAGLAVFAALSLVRPKWLRGSAPALVIGVTAALLAATLFARQLEPQSMLYPPAHYVARTAAGCVLWVLLVVLWLHRTWRTRPPALLGELRRPEIGRRLASAMLVLVLAAAVPDIALTRLWIGYLGWFRELVVGHTGFLNARELPMQAWPNRLFAQEWTYPALSVILRSRPGDAIVLADTAYRTDQPFDPRCGTIPRLAGYSWH